MEYLIDKHLSLGLSLSSQKNIQISSLKNASFTTSQGIGFLTQKNKDLRFLNSEDELNLDANIAHK